MVILISIYIFMPATRVLEAIHETTNQIGMTYIHYVCTTSHSTDILHFISYARLKCIKYHCHDQIPKNL